MPQLSLEEQIGQLVAQAASRIASLIKADIIAQLQGAPGTTPSRGARGRAPAASAKATGGKRGGRRNGVDEAAVSRVLKVIEDSPGLRTEEIYKKLSLRPEQAKKALAKLRAEKRVKTKGQKRATTYAPA